MALHNCLKTGNFPFFILGLGFFIISLLGTGIRTPLQDPQSSIWRQNDHRDIMQNLFAHLIFQVECRMKIEHVLFPSVFSKLPIRASEGHFQCVHTIQFSEPTKIGSLKRIVCERAFKGYFSLKDFHAWAACNGQNSKE